MSAKRIGLYPGTFDPVTLGHMDIIKRAVKLVDHLVIGVANNPSKTQAFTIEDEAEFVRFMVAEIPPAPPEAARIRAANSGTAAAAA